MNTSGPSSQQQELLQEVHNRIQELQAALEQVSATRKLLQCNAMQVREQIQSGISRQLEALRTREVWLLQQVEVVQRVKEGMLQEQAESLQQALGGLHALAQCSEEADVTSLSRHLESVDKLALQPEENAAISFRSDSVGLRTMIQHWGKVDGRYGPLEGAFADVDVGAASLPRVLEEYEDEEHHVLYKTVQGLKGSAENVIDVKIPKLSNCQQDWLLPPSPSQAAASMQEQPALLFPPFREGLTEWLNGENVVTNNSLQQWLSELWHEGRPEEEDFEVLGSSCTQSVSGEGMEDCCGGNFSVPEYFQQVSGAPNTCWLMGANMPAMTYPFKVMQYFHEMASSTKQWLQEYEASHLNEKEPGQVTCHSPVMDIEDLDEELLISKAVTKYFTEVPTDLNLWLHKGGNKHDVDADLDDRSTDNEPSRNKVHEMVQRLCIANEPCQDFSQCLCEDNCALRCGIISGEGMSKWLSPNACHKPHICLADPDAFAHSSLPTSDWLMSGQDSNCNADRELFVPFGPHANTHWLSHTTNDSDQSFPGHYPYFSQILKMAPDQWVYYTESEKSESDYDMFDSTDFSHSTDDINIWLCGSSVKSQSVPMLQLCCFTPLENDLTSTTTMDNKWLVRKSSSKDVCSVQPMFSVFKQISSSASTPWLCAEKKVDEVVGKSEELPELSHSESFLAIKDEESNFTVHDWLLVPPI